MVKENTSVSTTVYNHVIPIPSNQDFLTKWYNWTHAKVSRHFRRDKERILDTAQNVRVRLLSKDFVGRWFFKHLTGELVDKSQAERILGNRSNIAFIGSLTPFEGNRNDSKSLWRISDILNFAKFDYERYYYSIQGHTLDAAKTLRMLGYGPTDYSVLESMYRQGRIRPSELTEHYCKEIPRGVPANERGCASSGCAEEHYSRGYCGSHYRKIRSQSCTECDRGRISLRSRGISLAKRWTDPSIIDTVSKLRFNDRQLAPFLREWQNKNMVRVTPEYIMRSKKHGIDAGLLKYAEMVIDHEVVNDFKRMSRADDLSSMVLQNRLDPEFGNGDTVCYEASEEGDMKEQILRDPSGIRSFHSLENKHDLERLTEGVSLTDEEFDVVQNLDLGDLSASEYAHKHGLRGISRIHRLRSEALRKLRGETMSDDKMRDLAFKIAGSYGCTVSQMLGPIMVGPPVIARGDFFAALFDSGMTITAIASKYECPEDRILAGINRATNRETRHVSAIG